MEKLSILTAIICVSAWMNYSKPNNENIFYKKGTKRDITSVPKVPNSIKLNLDADMGKIMADPIVIDAMKNFEWQWQNCPDRDKFSLGINNIEMHR